MKVKVISWHFDDDGILWLEYKSGQPPETKTIGLVGVNRQEPIKEITTITK